MAKAILVFCVTATLIHFEISSAAEIGDPLEGKSAISTEYKARYHKIHQNGLNTSEGYIAGIHNMEKNTDQESWPSFATKCAEVIKGIVAALTGAVSSEPGDRTDLQLDFRNRIYHHDNRNSNASDENGLPEPEDYDEPKKTQGYEAQYKSNPYETVAVEPNQPDQLPEEEYAEEVDYRNPPDPNFHEEPQQPLYVYGNRTPGSHPDGSNHEMDLDDPAATESSPEPTWNTPATQEVTYRPTEQMTGIPPYGGTRSAETDPNPVRDGEIVGATQRPFLGVPSSRPVYQTTPDIGEVLPATELAEADNPYRQPPPTIPESLPLDHWKPIREGQPDFLPEAPAVYGEGPTSSAHVFTISPEFLTTPSPDEEEDSETSYLPAAADDDPPPHPRIPESANQLSQTPLTDHPDDLDYSSGEEEEEEELPTDPQEEEATPSPPKDLIPDATQRVPEIRTEFDPAAANSVESGNPLPPYGVPERIFKMLASSTQPPPAIYIPISNSQTESMTEGPTDLDEDCCCDEDTYDDETPNHKAICKNACRDLEQARNELKEIFDKIKKKLKCSRRLSS